MPEILLIAFSLALDAAAVSISISAAFPGGWPQALRLGLWFGSFQFLMPLLGHTLGRALTLRFSSAAPWVAFVLLAYIGGKLLWDALSPSPRPPLTRPLTRPRLFLLALATSLDALATGVSLACMALPLWLSCSVIGSVAFALSVLAALCGSRLGRRWCQWAGALGGVALMAIGVKFLLQSL